MLNLKRIALLFLPAQSLLLIVLAFAFPDPVIRYPLLVLGAIGGAIGLLIFREERKIGAAFRASLLSARNLKDESRNLMSFIDKFNVLSNQQSVRVQELARHMANVSVLANENANNAREAESKSRSSRNSAELGSAEIDELILAMKSITAGSRKVSEITSVLDEIAFQTNLLALNAAVEAARAGEHGRNFAVVAESVRELAKHSADGAREIREQIEINSAAAKRGSDAANRSGVALQGIVAAIKDVASLNESISKASQVQLESIQLVNATNSELNNFAKDTTETAHHSQLAMESVANGSVKVHADFSKLQSAIEVSLGGDRESPHSEFQGVNTNEILIGMSNALTGNSSALGVGMKQGASAYFESANRQGGVAGRQIRLLSFDDRYEPAFCVQHTERLLKIDKVFCLYGYVGTPTSIAALAVVNAQDVPFVGAFTGAQSLRVPLNQNVFNVRASYVDETERIIAFAVDQLKLRKIALFIQDDSYGAAGESGVLRALSARELQPMGKGVYKRNTIEVDSAVDHLVELEPEAIVMIGAYKACAEFVRKMRASGSSAKLFSISFVGTSAFVSEAGPSAEGVYISQVTPSPWETARPIVREYQQDMIKNGTPDFDYSSLEGYIGARVLIEAIASGGVAGLTRAALRSSLEAFDKDLGSFRVSFNESRHEGSNKVWLTQIRAGKARPVDSN